MTKWKINHQKGPWIESMWRLRNHPVQETNNKVTKGSTSLCYWPWWTTTNSFGLVTAVMVPALTHRDFKHSQLRDKLEDGALGDGDYKFIIVSRDCTGWRSRLNGGWMETVETTNSL